jgi:hypothetical protein
MTKTEKMIEEINGFLAAIGEEKLVIPGENEGLPELELLNRAQKEYLKRLRKSVPKYRLLPSAIIPDGFLVALKNREAELKT